MLEGKRNFSKWVSKFGFGKRTGVELPGEEIGQVLPVSHYSGSSMGNLPIGQGQLVTPLQMASAYSAIANGGILRPPHIIRSVGSESQPVPAGHRVISSATAASLRQMLEGVLAPGGTASEVSIPGYQLAGKTGTASKVDQATGEYSKSALRRLVHGLCAGVGPEAAVRGDRRRTAGRVDLRRNRRGARLRADHELRAPVPAHRAGIASAHEARRVDRRPGHSSHR